MSTLCSFWWALERLLILVADVREFPRLYLLARADMVAFLDLMGLALEDPRRQPSAPTPQQMLHALQAVILNFYPSNSSPRSATKLPETTAEFSVLNHSQLLYFFLCQLITLNVETGKGGWFVSMLCCPLCGPPNS